MRLTNIYLLLSLLLSSCSQHDNVARNVVVDCVGNEMIIPDDLKFLIIDNEIDLDINDFDFKIINYIDSTGCTSCRMKLQAWNEVISEFKSIPGINIEFFTIVDTQDLNNLEILLAQDNYLHPVSNDISNTFRNCNNLPNNTDYHTFLLNSENIILALGNPVFNPKVKKLYKSIILGNIGENNVFDDKFKRNYTHSVGLINVGDTVTVTFCIDNIDTVANNILSIMPSCDCIKTLVDSSTVSAKSEFLTHLSFVADSVTGYFDKYVDVYYKDKDEPDRLIVYGYII